MPLGPGTRLGPYEILAPIGAGGMGEVYRARDTRLKREVALKILPETFAADSERLARFQLQTFPNPGGKWQISTHGGQDPIWRRDDKELFYVAGDGQMMAVSVAGGTPFEAGVAKPLFTATNFPGWSIGGWGRYAVSADGQRFLIDVPAKDTFSPITVVLNWAAEFINKN